MSIVETPSSASAPNSQPRHDWTREELRSLFELPLSELVFRAQSIHRAYFDPATVQISTLLSIKTGGCRRTAPIVRKAPTSRPASPKKG